SGSRARHPKRPPPAAIAAVVTDVFLRRDGAVGEQVLAELLVQSGVVAPQPFEGHRRVLLLIVPVVLENRPELVVVAGGGARVVPVARLQPLHDRAGRPVPVDPLGPQLLRGLVQGCAGPGHSTPPIPPIALTRQRRAA